jgi:hypothetical protein
MLISPIFFFTGIVTLQFKMASIRILVHRGLSCAYFPHLLAPIDSIQLSIQSKHLNFLLHDLILLFGSPRNTFFTVLSSDILIT